LEALTVDFVDVVEPQSTFRFKRGERFDGFALRQRAIIN